MSIKIRQSILEDVFGIRAVQRETWFVTYPNSEEGITLGDIQEKFKDDNTPEGKKLIEDRKKRFTDPNSRTWVAEENGKVIGFCIAAKEIEQNRIQAVYVLPAYHGKGIGHDLFSKALSWLGIEKDIYINCARYNQKALSFYKKHGFVETGKSGVFDAASALPSGKFIQEVELVKKVG